jgi:hypothetical protein
MSLDPSTRRSGLQWAFSLLCLASLLLLTALAASPALHEHIHHDAAKTDHECAVTLFAHGKIDFTSSTPVVVLIPGFEVEASLPRVAVLVAADYQLLPGRAPPLLFV